MNRLLSTAALLALLAGCGDGQPFEFDESTQGDGSGGGDGDGGTDDGGDGGIDGDGAPTTDGGPVGDDATARQSIFRSEGTSEDNNGGFVSEVSYSAASDTFTVDNLAFDGENTYQRYAAFPSLAGYALYQSDETVTDSKTGAPVRQLDYRAIYGVSTNRVTVNGERLPRSRFAIVRTGSYRDYGFGGFVYERNGGVELPETGQAVFTGDYAGVRVFRNSSGLEYTRADAEISVDFEDFNDPTGVMGTLTNRRVFDSDGDPVPLGGPGQLLAPTLPFEIGPGVLSENGEIRGDVSNTIINDNGDVEAYEVGEYYGIIGGDADEIVGIIVMESDDPRFDDIRVQETGGFIVYR